MKQKILIFALFGLFCGTKMQAQITNWCINLNSQTCPGAELYFQWSCNLTNCPSGCGTVGGPLLGPYSPSPCPAITFDPSNTCENYTMEIYCPSPCNGNTYTFTFVYVCNDLYCGWLTEPSPSNPPNHIYIPNFDLNVSGGTVNVNVYDDTNDNGTGTAYGDY